MSPDAYARSVARVKDEAAAIGRDLDGFEWMLYLYCSVRADGDRARDDVAQFLGSAYGDKPREMLDRIAPAGTPDEVAARIQPYIDAGARHIVISPAAPEDTARGRDPRRHRGAPAAGGPDVIMAGLSVVEVAVGASELGLGHAGGVPGMGVRRARRHGHPRRRHRDP